MDVVIAGGHGKVALLLAERLTARGDRVRALVRNADHRADVSAAGAEPVLFDLEHDDNLAAAIAGADAVVFAAGAGGGSGIARKMTVDRDGALALASACLEAGVRRYVLLSTIGARVGADTGDEVFDAYLAAKFEADEGVLASGLAVTVVRPGTLTGEPGVGTVLLAEHVERGEVSRADVAAVLAAALHTPSSIGAVVELVAGETPVEAAVAGL
jgi:uncharacterized protein YbjT (DUF2867 family)